MTTTNRLLNFTFLREHSIQAILGIVLSALAVGVIWHQVERHRFLLEPASAAYLSVADNLWRGHPYTRYDGDPAPDWPPLTSIALLLPLAITHDSTAAFAILNALCFILLIAISGRWLSRYVRIPWVKVFTLLLLVSAMPMRRVEAAGFSEPLFTVLGLAALILLDPVSGSGSSVRAPWRFAVACLLTGLACLTRYIGVTVVAAGCILILFQDDLKMQIRLLRLVSFAIASFLPLSLWCLRNYALTKTFMGGRTPAHITLGQNLSLTVEVFESWFISPIFFFLLFIAAIALAGWLPRKFGSIRALRPLLPPVVFIIIYAVILLGSASRIDMDEIDTRLLFPVFVPLLWSLAFLVDSALGACGKAAWQRLGLVVWGFVSAWIGWYGLTVQLDDYDGYNQRKWSDARLVQSIGPLPSGARLYSNDAPACYLLLHRRSAWLPKEDEDETNEVIRRDLKNAPGPGYYLWFDQTLTDSDENINFVKTEGRHLSEVAHGSHFMVLKIKS